MARSSLHAQASAIDVARIQAERRGQVKMRLSEWEMQEQGLKAASNTLLSIQNWRGLLPEAFLAEIEG